MTKRILIVDDEVDLCELLSFQLVRSGYDVTTAAGGKTAFALFERDPFDLVVTDIRMPNGDGLGLLSAIRNSSRATVPVILMTGFADTDWPKAKLLGANGFLNKPFHLDELLAVVAAQLDTPRSVEG